MSSVPAIPGILPSQWGEYDENDKSLQKYFICQFSRDTCQLCLDAPTQR